MYIMFDFFKFKNKNIQNKCNLYLDVSFNDNKNVLDDFINRSSIPLLDLNNPTDLKIYNILIELDKHNDEVYFSEYDRREKINEKTSIQEEIKINNINNKIKNENIKTFISQFNSN